MLEGASVRGDNGLVAGLGFGFVLGLILGGLGMDVVLSPAIDVFAEGRFLHLFTEEEASAFVPASLGIRIKF